MTDRVSETQQVFNKLAAGAETTSHGEVLRAMARALKDAYEEGRNDGLAEVVAHCEKKAAEYQGKPGEGAVLDLGDAVLALVRKTK